MPRALAGVATKDTVKRPLRSSRAVLVTALHGGLGHLQHGGRLRRAWRHGCQRDDGCARIRIGDGRRVDARDERSVGAGCHHRPVAQRDRAHVVRRAGRQPARGDVEVLQPATGVSATAGDRAP